MYANQYSFRDGVLRVIHQILVEDKTKWLKFEKVEKSKNVKNIGNAKYLGGILYVNNLPSVYLQFNCHNVNALEHTFVHDTLLTACYLGISVCVTITPTQIAIHKTFIPNTLIQERVLRLVPISHLTKFNMQHLLSELSKILSSH